MMQKKKVREKGRLEEYWKQAFGRAGVKEGVVERGQKEMKEEENQEERRKKSAPDKQIAVGKGTWGHRNHKTRDEAMRPTSVHLSACKPVRLCGRVDCKLQAGGRDTRDKC